jgi:hypothetical protein
MEIRSRWLSARKNFKYVQFHPAVGRSYAHSRFGLRIMVLGESQYHWHAIPRDRSQTTLAAIRSCDHYPFWKKLSALFPPGEFWSQVLFYNYVQHIVGWSARRRPAAAMWRSPESVEGFKEILHIYKPERILVIGKTTWQNMAGTADDFPGQQPMPEPRFSFSNKFGSNLERSERCAYWYPIFAGHFALAAPIFHPGYPTGFHSSATKQVVETLLRKAWKSPKVQSEPLGDARLKFNIRQSPLKRKAT